MFTASGHGVVKVLLETRAIRRVRLTTGGTLWAIAESKPAWYPTMRTRRDGLSMKDLANRQSHCADRWLVVPAFLFAAASPTRLVAGDWYLAPRHFREVLSVSNQGYVVRVSRRHATARDQADYEADHGAFAAGCGYPRIDGVTPFAVDLLVCSFTGTPPCRTWTIHSLAERRDDCSTEPDAQAALANATRSMSSLALSIGSVSAPALDRGSAALEKVLARWNAGGNVVAGRLRRGPICGVQFVSTYGRLTLVSESSSNRYGSCGSYRLVGVNLSPDESFAIFSVENYLEQKTVVWRTKQIAARVVNAHGFQAHKKKQYQDSERLFQEALQLDPGFGQAAFNLACAQALLHKTSQALESLGIAITKERDRFRAKAATDRDLDGIRGDARFQALIGPQEE